jgi:CubicO group peptidase (beta-lactamase class C family)
MHDGSCGNGQSRYAGTLLTAATRPSRPPHGREDRKQKAGSMLVESTMNATALLMQGYPAPPERRVSLENMLIPPYNRWAFQHMRELLPTREISRGHGPVSVLVETPRSLDAVRYLAADGSTGNLATLLDITGADALVVLHEGRLVHEEYRNGMQPGSKHLMWSVTKSFVGTLAEQLAHEGALDLDASVTHYVPELAGSAWGDASVQHALDMATGIQFNEIYDDPTSEIGLYSVAAGFMPVPDGYTGPRNMSELLPVLMKEGEHGYRFHYVTPNTDVAGWIIARASGKPFSRLLSERIWSRLGMEADAYVIVDSIGMELTGGGLSASARDLARFGQLLLDDGVHDGERIIASEVVARIRAGGDKEAFARAEEGETDSPFEGWSYRSFWWVSHNEHEAFTGVGINGQWLYVDPTANVVIVMQSSHPEAVNLDADVAVVRGFGAIARHLSSK